MENTMKEILVSGIQSRVENETFVKRIALLLSDDLMEIFCTGVPIDVLGYNEAKIKEYIEKNTGREEIAIDSVGMSNYALEPVTVYYYATAIRYMKTVDDAEKAMREQNRYAGNTQKTEEFCIAAKIRFSSTIKLPIEAAKKLCTLKML